MHIKRFALYSLLPLGLMLSGCVVVVDGNKNDKERSGSSATNWENQEQQNRRYIAQLNTGEPLSEILSRMGTPDFDEKLVKNETEYRILYYRTQRVTADGITTRDECTPLVFANGRLSGWGEHKLTAISITL